MDSNLVKQVQCHKRRERERRNEKYWKHTQNSSTSSIKLNYSMASRSQQVKVTNIIRQQHTTHIYIYIYDIDCVAVADEKKIIVILYVSLCDISAQSSLLHHCFPLTINCCKFYFLLKHAFLSTRSIFVQDVCKRSSVESEIAIHFFFRSLPNTAQCIFFFLFSLCFFLSSCNGRNRNQFSGRVEMHERRSRKFMLIIDLKNLIIALSYTRVCIVVCCMCISSIW